VNLSQSTNDVYPTAVKIALQTLERHGSLAQNDLRRVSIALREVLNIELLLNEVLEYARPPSLSLVPGDPRSPVEEAIASVEAEWASRGVTFARSLPDRMAPVAMDPVRIRTVVPIAGWSDLFYSLLPNGRERNSLDGPGGFGASRSMACSAHGPGSRAAAVTRRRHSTYPGRAGRTLGPNIKELKSLSATNSVRAPTRPAKDTNSFKLN